MVRRCSIHPATALGRGVEEMGGRTRKTFAVSIPLVYKTSGLQVEQFRRPLIGQHNILNYLELMISIPHVTGAIEPRPKIQ